MALKNFYPEIEAHKLQKRIDRLAAEGKITVDLKNWAHKIRIDGNEILHEEEEPTFEHASALKLFTEMMLTYLYTLPALVQDNLPDPEELEDQAT